MKRVLIIGGYGNFGSYIARSLAGDAAITLLIGGRSREKGARFAGSLAAANPVEAHRIDIEGDLGADLAAARPDIVVHTTGPFQRQGYGVARTCIAFGCHYVDLADARAFVAGIDELDEAAKAADVLVVSGASSVPCLTAAVIDHFAPQFSELVSLDYGISAAQQTNRGLATTTAVLSYVGRPFCAWCDGEPQQVYGWQDTHSEVYPVIGRRWFGNCDIPDLALFPERYPSLRAIRFGAGHELPILHFGTRALGWLVRRGMIKPLDRHAGSLLKLAFLFDRLGSGRSGFHMFLRGFDAAGRARRVAFYLVALSGHGPYIPCMPAILLARQLARDEIPRRGAMPCLDLIDLESYLAALDGLDISVYQATDG